MIKYLPRTPQFELVAAKKKKGWMFPLHKISFLLYLTLLHVSSSSLLSFQFHCLFYCNSSSCNTCSSYCFAFALPSASFFALCYHNDTHKHTHTLSLTHTHTHTLSHTHTYTCTNTHRHTHTHT